MSSTSSIVASLRHAGWAPAGVFAIHVVASLGLDAYNRLPGLDVPMHVLGGAAMAHFLTDLVLRAQDDPRVGPLTRAVERVLVVTTTCCISVLWEFAEWGADRWLHTRVQIGLDDTLLDIALGVTGSVLLVLFRSRFAGRGR